MCLEKGDILHIQNYKFEDGGEPKDKYLIVITVSEDKYTFIRVLTTSQQKIPNNKLQHGCCNSSCGMYSHYVFLKDAPVCENGFSFKKHTFIYFQHNVFELNISDFIQKQSTPSVKGKLTDSEHRRVLKCIKASRHVKRKIKEQL